MNSRITLVGALVVLAGACGFGWQNQPVGVVGVREDDRTLVVGYHCEPDASVEAQETADEVRLTFRIYSFTGNDCAEVEEVELDAPLAGRRVIDTWNDAEIRPCRVSTPPDGQPCG